MSPSTASGCRSRKPDPPLRAARRAADDRPSSAPGARATADRCSRPSCSPRPFPSPHHPERSCHRYPMPTCRKPFSRRMSISASIPKGCTPSGAPTRSQRVPERRRPSRRDVDLVREFAGETDPIDAGGASEQRPLPHRQMRERLRGQVDIARELGEYGPSQGTGERYASPSTRSPGRSPREGSATRTGAIPPATGRHAPALPEVVVMRSRSGASITTVPSSKMTPDSRSMRP